MFQNIGFDLMFSLGMSEFLKPQVILNVLWNMT